MRTPGPHPFSSPPPRGQTQRSMHQRTSVLLEVLRKNRTDSKKSPHPIKLLGAGYHKFMNQLAEEDAKEMEKMPQLLEGEEEIIRKKTAQVTWEAEDAHTLNYSIERLANLYLQTVREEMEQSAQRYKAEREKTPELVAELQKRVIAYGGLVKFMKKLEDEMYRLSDSVIEQHSHLCEQGVELFKLRQKSKRNLGAQKYEPVKETSGQKLDLLTMKTVLGIKSVDIAENQKVTYTFKNGKHATVSKNITPNERQTLWVQGTEPSQKRVDPDWCEFSVGHLKAKAK